MNDPYTELQERLKAKQKEIEEKRKAEAKAEGKELWGSVFVTRKKKPRQQAEQTEQDESDSIEDSQGDALMTLDPNDILFPEEI